MNIDVVTIEKNALPNALLDPFKRWQRIDFSTDDVLITEILQGAIEQFERNTEITVFATSLTLWPEAGDYPSTSSGLLRLPVTPVNTLTLADAAGAPIVISGGNYVLKSRGVHGVRIWTLNGALVEGMSIAVTTGYSETTLPPEIRTAINQIAGHYYEYREIMLPTNITEPPIWLNQIMAGFWLPRA